MAGRFSVEGIFKGSDSLSAVVAKIHGNFSKFQRSARNGMLAMDSAASKFTSAFTAAAKVTSVAAIAAGGALALAAKPGMDFEEAITAVGAVSLMTRGQIANLEKKAVELGASTKFSATEVANGMELMGRAGFDNEQILSGISGVLNAAAAEGAELAETAGHVSNVLKGMGLETSEATRVADVLTLASARTNSSIGSLGESMANVASTARQFKIPLEQAVASVALLQDQGLDASVAGSALNTMLTNLANPTAKVAANMAAMGVKFQDAKGNMLPLEQVFANLQKGAKKSGGNMKQVAFFADLVGLRGQKAASNLKDLFASGKFTELATELNSAKGSAEKMAKLRMDNLKGDLELLSGSADSLAVSFFNLNSRGLREVVQGTTAWLDANSALIKVKFVEFLDNARFAVDLFASGARQGLGVARAAISGLTGPLGQASDMLGSWPGIAQKAGLAFGIFVTATGTFFAFYAAAKLVQGTLVAVEFGTKAVSAAIWLGNEAVGAYTLVTNSATAGLVRLKAAEYAGAAATWAKNAALWFGQMATTRITFAMVGQTAAMVANTAWTWLKNAAQVAHNAVLWLAGAATTAYELATGRTTIAAVAATAWTWLKNAAHVAHNAVLWLGTAATSAWAIITGTATTATLAGASATTAATASFAPFLIAIGAAAAAIGALVAVYMQWQELSKQAGGAGGVWEGVKSFASGDGFFKGMDADLDRKAKAEAAARDSGPQVVSPQDRAAAALQSTNTTTTNRSEVVISPKAGAVAAFTKSPPKGGGVRLAPSGAM